GLRAGGLPDLLHPEVLDGPRMIAYVVRRLLLLVPVWIILSVLSFALLHLAEGSPAALLLGPEATADQVRRLDEQLGLNDPSSCNTSVGWLTSCAATSERPTFRTPTCSPRCGRTSW